MVGRGQDTLDNAYNRHQYFWFWNDDDVVRPLREAFGPLQRGPILTLSIFSLLCLPFSLPIHLYLVDTFTYAASALSAASVRLSGCLLSDDCLCRVSG